MKKYDLIVVGGGISGVAAAVAAARDGISVLLIEKYGCLGGAMSNSLVYPFMKYSMQDENGHKKLLSDGIFTEMRERWKAYGDHSCFIQLYLKRIALTEEYKGFMLRQNRV